MRSPPSDEGDGRSHPNPLPSVPRFKQRDSAQLAQRDRCCFSSSCAMLLEASPELAAQVLGWRARRSLAEMCRDGWRWQQSNPNGYAG